MAELFYFDKGVFDQLPPVERTKFRALLKTNMIPNGRPFFLDDNGLPEQILDGFCKYLLCPQRAREGANKRGNSSRLSQSFHFFMFEPFFLP